MTIRLDVGSYLDFFVGYYTLFDDGSLLLPSNRGSAEEEGQGLFSGQRVTSCRTRGVWGLIDGIAMLVHFHDFSFSFFGGQVQTALKMDDKKKQFRLNRQQTKKG